MPPDVTQTALVLEEITGESLAWGEVVIDPPVVSGTDVVYAVFELPAYVERTADGLGGGPGIGYFEGGEWKPSFLSPDGSRWSPLQGEFSLQVEVVSAMSKGAAAQEALADLREECPDGWWSQVKPHGEEAQESEASDEVVPALTARAPLEVIPNPFNPSTKIHFYLKTAGKVTIDIYDVRGRKVRSLLQEEMIAGSHQVMWRGEDERSQPVASGIYFIRMLSPEGMYEKRAALVR